jgi:hypothetical protein
MNVFINYSSVKPNEIQIGDDLICPVLLHDNHRQNDHSSFPAYGWSLKQYAQELTWRYDQAMLWRYQYDILLPMGDNKIDNMILEARLVTDYLMLGSKSFWLSPHPELVSNGSPSQQAVKQAIISIPGCSIRYKTSKEFQEKRFKQLFNRFDAVYPDLKEWFSTKPKFNLADYYTKLPPAFDNAF